MSKRPLTPDEAKAWSRVAKSIKPIGPAPEDFGALISALEAGEPDQKAPGNGPKIPTMRPGIPREVPANGPGIPPGGPANRGKEKRVKRGKLVVSATFDLHGHTQATAARALPGFLANAQADGSRCVLIITGKGRLGEGVLKRNFLGWLDTDHARTLVSGYAEAHQRHGGAGAFYVFLRKLQS